MSWPTRAPPTIPGSTARSIGSSTIAYREYLWDLGLGVAEAMDTAQRGMGLDWPTSLELIQRAVKAGKAWEARKGRPALIVSGCGTDHLDLASVRSIDEVIRAYEEQMAAIEKAGGRLIVMASRALARVAKSPADYERVYDRVLGQAREPVIIHWLGEMFDPALAGYWGSPDHMQAMQTAVGIINAHAAKVDGVKISLLDKEKEIVMRRQLAKGVRMYTGDDFNYAELIAGDEQGYSDALLGIFDAIAPAASAALGGARRRRPRALRRHPGADGAAVAPHLQGADPLLQDGRGVHGLPQRPAGPFRHGRRPAERALDCRTWPSCSASPTAPGCCAIRIWRAGAWCACWPCTGSPDARLWRATYRYLSINTATVRSSSRCPPSSRPACGAASAPSVPGATRCRRPAWRRSPGR